MAWLKLSNPTLNESQSRPVLKRLPAFVLYAFVICESFYLGRAPGFA